MFKKALCCVLYYALFSSANFVVAEEAAEGNEAAVDYQYFQLEPDIITNYIQPGKRIGYVRVSVDLMVKSSADYEEVETHDPLIRDRIITILGEQNEQQIKSMADRETLRQRCLSEVNEVLFEFVGHRPVKDLYFTKYLYQ